MPKGLSIPLLCDYAESEQLEANVVPIGLTTESLEIAGIRLAESLYIVAGGVASGRTNLLKVIINAINPSIRVFVVDDKAQELLTVCTASNVTYVSNKDAFWKMLDCIKAEIAKRESGYNDAKAKNSLLSPKNFYMTCEPMLIVCSNLEEMVEYINEAGATAEKMLIGAQDYNICTIVDCGANVSRIGSDYIKYVKNTPTGVVTGNFMNQSVFMGMGVRVPIDNTAGVGYICDKGSITKIRIAKD